MISRINVAALLAAAMLAGNVAAQTGQSVNPSPMPPGSRAGDAPGMGSIGSQSEGGVVGQPTRPQTPDAAAPGGTAPAATGPAMTEEQARTQLQAAGYTDIRELQRDPRGLWHGHAVRNGQQIIVSIDPQGEVTARQ